jgi:cell division protease FtsH
MEMIDGEVSRILREGSDRATQLLSDGRDKLDGLARALLEKEELGDEEIAAVLGPSIHAAATTHASKVDGLSHANAAKVAAR